MLALACIGFMGCKKDKSAETSPETTKTETVSETISGTETEDFSETKTKSKSKAKTPTGTETETSSSGKTTTTGTETGTTTGTETTTEIFLDAENALQEAEIDEEERKAIEAVQQTEPPIYYHDPVLDFDTEGYSNLHIEGYGFSLFNSSAGNIYQDFYETTNLSGADLLFLKNAVENVSGSTFDIEQVKSSTGQSLEESEKLLYRNDSIYAEMDRFGNFYMQNNTLKSDSLWTPEENQEISLIADEDDLFHSWDYALTFEQQEVQFKEVREFLEKDYIRQLEDELFPEKYTIYDLKKIEKVQLKDGRIGCLFTYSVDTRLSQKPIDSRKRSRYENENRAVNGQYVQIFMLNPDSVDYLYLPPVLTRKPDYQQMLSGKYCTLAEACQILSDNLPSDQVFDVENIQLGFGTVFFYDEEHQFQGMACVPMWYMDLLSPEGEVIFANVDADTRELYFSYE